MTSKRITLIKKDSTHLILKDFDNYIYTFCIDGTYSIEQDGKEFNPKRNSLWKFENDKLMFRHPWQGDSIPASTWWEWGFASGDLDEWESGREVIGALKNWILEVYIFPENEVK